MKFQDYPYQRVEMEALEQAYQRLMKAFEDGSIEELVQKLAKRI